METTPKNIVITGNPGIGKTTLIKECVFPFNNKVGGFYTEELREGEKRTGFILKTLDGQSGILAKKGLESPTKLNKYGVDLSILEKIGLDALQKARKENQIVLIDEIGSMEMLSPRFCEDITRILAGSQKFLATIRLRAEPFTSTLKKMTNTEIWELTKNNFIELKDKIRNWIEDS